MGRNKVLDGLYERVDRDRAEAMGLDVPEPEYLSLTITATCAVCGIETRDAERDQWLMSPDSGKFYCPSHAQALVRNIIVARVRSYVGQKVEVRTADLETVADGTLHYWTNVAGYGLSNMDGIRVFRESDVLDTALGPGGRLIILVSRLVE